MEDKKGVSQKEVRVVTEYEYLGVLFTDTGSFQKHIGETVLTKVKRRLWGLASTVVNHDILSPDTSQ